MTQHVKQMATFVHPFSVNHQVMTPWEDISVTISFVEQLTKSLQVTTTFLLTSVPWGITSTSRLPISVSDDSRFVWWADCVSTIRPMAIFFISLNWEHDALDLAMEKGLALVKSPSVLFLTRDLSTWIVSDGAKACLYQYWSNSFVFSHSEEENFHDEGF